MKMQLVQLDKGKARFHSERSVTVQTSQYTEPKSVPLGNLTLTREYWEEIGRPQVLYIRQGTEPED